MYNRKSTRNWGPERQSIRRINQNRIEWYNGNDQRWREMQTKGSRKSLVYDSSEHSCSPWLTKFIQFCLSIELYFESLMTDITDINSNNPGNNYSL